MLLPLYASLQRPQAIQASLSHSRAAPVPPLNSYGSDVAAVCDEIPQLAEANLEYSGSMRGSPPEIELAPVVEPVHDFQ